MLFETEHRERIYEPEPESKKAKSLADNNKPLRLSDLENEDAIDEDFDAEFDEFDDDTKILVGYEKTQLSPN